MIRINVVVTAVVIGVLALTASAVGQSPPAWTWLGTTNGNWSVGTNWGAGLPPGGANGVPVGGPSTQLYFGGGTTTVMAQDLGANFQINQLNFFGALPFSLSGSSLQFHTDPMFGTTPKFNMSADSPVTINTALGLNDSSLGVSVTGAGALTLNGPISGGAGLGLITGGRGTLILGGTNTYQGATSVTAGTLAISADANLGAAPALPTTDLTIANINNATLAITVGFNLSANRTVTTGAGVATIDVGAAQTFVVPGQLQIGAGGLVKAGLGTLVLAGSSGIANTTVSAGTLQCDAANVTGTIVDNGNVAFNEAGNVSFAGGLNGTGTLTKLGAGTLTLTAANGYQGGAIVSGGTLSYGADNQLGSAGGPVTVNNAATVLFNGTISGPASTTRTLNINNGSFTTAAGTNFTLNGSLVNLTSGSLNVGAGGTLTYAGAAVNGGFLRGSGTHVVTGGSTFSGTSTFNSTVVSVTGAGTFSNFSNGGTMNVAAALLSPVSFNGFINQGSGSITVGAGSQPNAADFQTYGTLTLSPGTSAVPTQMTNTGTSPLNFNGGSRTFISVPQNASLFDAGIDLHGNNATVAGGLLVNNGYVIDSVGAGTKTVIADFGSLVKGAGFYQNSVQTVNGGKFQSGNSPGQATFGAFTFGPGGVTNYVFAIDDAAGTAGPKPDASGQVSGWGLVKAVQRSVGSATTPGDFAWTANTTHPVTVHLDTLVNPTTVGTDVAGPMADFDPTRPFSWLAASWAGAYSGPTDAAALNAATAFDTAGFLNPVAGTFGWQLDPAGHALSLTYTPTTVPEPGTFALTALAGLAWFVRRRR